MEAQKKRTHILLSSDARQPQEESLEQFDARTRQVICPCQANLNTEFKLGEQLVLGLSEPVHDHGGRESIDGRVEYGECKRVGLV